jgi:RNA polymerase sigma factor (sigma-70 family)
MMMNRTMESMPIEDLLAHARWVQGFARALVADAGDDVAQDAWVAAIRKPPVAGSQPRAWFATVMRNAARMRFRGASRRAAREELEPALGPAPSAPDEAVHRMQLQRRLAELVLALDEPRRTVVVLAFFDGLTAAEIGRKLDVPATTVRSRLASALETMRAQLDADEGGDRARWHFALAPLVGGGPAGKGLPLGIAIAAVAIVACVLGGVLALASATSRSSQAQASAARGDDGVESAAINAQHAGASAHAGRAAPVLPANAASAARDARTGRGNGSADGDDRGNSRISPAFLRAQKVMVARVDECYELARKAGRELRGTVAMSLELVTHPEVDATVTLDPAKTTIKDADTLQCLRENPMAIVDRVQRLREAGEGIDGTIVVELTRAMPPPPPTPDDWPPDTASPTCAPGTALAGTHGKQQWCARPDGVKDGPDYIWDEKGRLVMIGTFTAGQSGPLRMHDPDPDPE